MMTVAEASYRKCHHSSIRDVEPEKRVLDMMRSLSDIGILTMLFLDISLSSADMTQRQYPVMKNLRFASVTSELLTQLDCVVFSIQNVHTFYWHLLACECQSIRCMHSLLEKLMENAIKIFSNIKRLSVVHPAESYVNTAGALSKPTSHRNKQRQPGCHG